MFLLIYNYLIHYINSDNKTYFCFSRFKYIWLSFTFVYSLKKMAFLKITEVNNKRKGELGGASGQA